MTKNAFDVFLHIEGEKPKVVAAQDDELLAAFLARAGVALGDGKDRLHVFIGESDDALTDDSDDGDDSHEVADLKATLKKLNVRAMRHIHCHRCRRITVEVNFGGKSKRRKFSPAATIRVVTEWARRKLRLDPAAAAEYVLQMCGTTEQPRSDVHLGELPTPNCALCFDLVKEITPQG